MARVAYFLLLGVALAFVVLSVSGQSDDNEEGHEDEDTYDDEDSDEDSDENYVNDESYVEYYQDEEDVGDEKEIEEVEVLVEEETAPDAHLPPCKPEYMFQQLDKVCAKYRDEDITELEEKCKNIDTAIADIRDLIFKTNKDVDFLIEKDDTTWTQKLSYPAIVLNTKKSVEILFDRKEEDSGIADCNDALGKGHEKPGVYLLNPDGSPYNVRALCVNGWTVVQRRFDGLEDFNREFDGYVAGFGNFSGEFFLGLENLHRMALNNAYTLRVDTKGASGKWYYGVYDDFSLSDETDQYRLSLGNMSAGNYFDGFDNSRDEQFSTRDRDNDKWRGGNCAEHYGGGWWSGTCNTNLNQRWCRTGCLRWASKRVVSSIIRIKPTSAVVPEDLTEDPNPAGLTLEESPA